MTSFPKSCSPAKTSNIRDSHTKTVSPALISLSLALRIREAYHPRRKCLVSLREYDSQKLTRASLQTSDPTSLRAFTSFSYRLIGLADAIWSWSRVEPRVGERVKLEEGRIGLLPFLFGVGLVRAVLVSRLPLEACPGPCACYYSIPCSENLLKD